jgi:hypothetical protein
MEKIDKNWPILVIFYVKSIHILFIAHGVQLDNGVDPPVHETNRDKRPKNLALICREKFDGNTVRALLVKT